MSTQHHKRYTAFFAVLLSLLLPFTALAAPQNTNVAAVNGHTALQPSRNFRQGEVLVKFKKESVDVSRFLGRMSVKSFELTKGLERKEIFEPQNLALMKSKKNETTEQLVARLKNDPRVEYVEPNFIRHFAATPNDTDFQNLWGLHNTGQFIDSGDLSATGTADADIDAPEAWEKHTGGTNVVVAILDTGVAYNHPDLANNMWNGSSGCNDDSGNAISGGCPNHGWDFANGDNDPIDDHGHGTHVAGTIGAEGNNSRGISGVNWTTKIMAVKVGNERGVIVSDWVKGLNFAKNNGAKIVNASFGGSEFSQTELDAIESFPGLFVVASGNGGADGIGDNNDTKPTYPASYDASNIISVAATDQDDNMVSFSNYGGTTVDVAAPGLNIYSTYPVFSTPFQETFDDVVAPDIGSQFTKEGTSNNWGTDNADSVTTQVLWTDINNIPYAADASTSVISSPIDLSGKANAKVKFYVNCDTDITAEWTDYMSLDVTKDGDVFDELFRFDEVVLGGNLTLYERDISEYMSEATQIRFRWTTDGSNDVSGNYTGCFVDKPTISSADRTGENYAYSSGTSMAAPHVAGLAALLKSYHGSLTDAQVKEIILNMGDDLPADFSGKTVSGKRVNAANALDVFSPRGGFDELDRIPSSQITQSTDGSGQVQVNFRAQDGIAGIPMGLITSSFQYSLDGGATFITPPSDLVFFSFPTNQSIVSATDLSGTVYNFLLLTQRLVGLENSDENNVVIKFQLYDGVDGLRSPYITSGEFRVNNTKPTALLTNTPPAITNINEVNITVSGDNVVSWQYSVDGNEFSTVTTVDFPIWLTGIKDGEHTIRVIGIDAQGNVQPIADATTFTWTIDTVAPTGTITNASGNPTNDATPTFQLTIGSSEGSGTQMQFSCDNSTWTDFETFASEKTDFDVSLDAFGCSPGDGAKTVYVQLQDEAGNMGASFNTGEFVLNSSEALAQFTLTPSNPSNDKNPQFTVGGTDIISYEYRVDPEDPAAEGGYSEETSIVSNIQLADLADGYHLLQAIGKNDAETWQPETAPTEFMWQVDATGPTLTIENNDGSPTNIAMPSLALSINDDGVGTDGAMVRFSCDGESWTDFEIFEEEKSNFDVHSGSNGCAAEDGAKIVFAQAQDSLGNIGEAAQTAEFTLDTTAPEITGLVSDVTPVKSKTWEWSSSDEGAVFRYSIDQSETGVPEGEYGAEKTAVQPNGDGTYYLHVQARDALGNESAVTTVSAALDNTAPTAILNNSPNNPTKLNSINVTVSGEKVKGENTEVDKVTHYKFKIDAADFGEEIPVETPISASDLSDGEHTLEVIGRDAAGNYQTEADSTRVTWIVDTTLVAAVLTGTPRNPTNATTVDITVSGEGVDFYKFILGDLPVSAEKPVSEHIVFSDLPETNYTIFVFGRSAAGSYPVQAESTQFSWVVDLTPPTAVLSGVPETGTLSTSATITVSGTDVTHYKFSLNGGAFGGETPVSTALSLSGLSAGENVVRVIGRDLAGNYQSTESATRAAWVIASPPPPPPPPPGGGGGGGPPFIQPPRVSPPPGKVLGVKKQRFPNGTIIKLRGKKQYYIIQKGTRKLLSPAELKKYSRKKIVEVDKKTLMAIPLFKKSKTSSLKTAPKTAAKPVIIKTLVEVAYPTVRIRNGIGYNSKILDTAHRGDRLELRAEKDGWYNVVWKNYDSAWMEGKWVVKL